MTPRRSRRDRKKYRQTDLLTLIKQEKEEHPWATKKQAERIVRDHLKEKITSKTKAEVYEVNGWWKIKVEGVVRGGQFSSSGAAVRYCKTMLGIKSVDVK